MKVISIAAEHGCRCMAPWIRNDQEQCEVCKAVQEFEATKGEG
jgi:hypothetical protein